MADQVDGCPGTPGGMFGECVRASSSTSKTGNMRFAFLHSLLPSF